MIEAFPVLAHLLPESRAALDRIGGFVTAAVAVARGAEAGLAS